MAFPTSPTDGQTATVNGVLYTYNSSTTAWNVTTAFTGNILTTTLSASGNVTSNFFLGNGSQLTGIASGAASNITSGTSNVKIVSPGGNVSVGVNGIANLAVFDTAGNATITGNLLMTGNIFPTANNTYWLGSPTMQWKEVYIGPGSLYINGQEVLSSSAETIVVSANTNQNLTLQTSGSGGIRIDPTGDGIIQVQGPMQIAAGNNITSSDGNAIQFANPIAVNTLTSQSLNNNLTLSANGSGIVSVTSTLNASGNISSSANISAGNVLSTTFIGTTVSVTGNVTGGNVTGTNLYGTLQTATQLNVTGLGTLTTLIVSGNTTSGNLLSGGIISVAGNVTGGNINTAGQVSSTGNITGSYILGNGSQLTGLPATYGNSNVAANLAAFGSNPVSTTGNITAGYFVGNGSQLTGLPATYGNANVVANLAALASNPVSTTGNISSSANISGANVLGTAVIGTTLSATANVIGGNVTTAGIGNIGTLAVTGTTTLTGNTTAGHMLPAANVSYDLGSATAQWRTIYVSGNTINMGGATIQTDAGSGSFAFVPPATAATPNPTGVVFGPSGDISTVTTTAGTITANLQIASSTTSTVLKVTSISYPGDDTAADPAGGQTITLTGSGFMTGAQVLIGTSPMTTAGSVTVVSPITITFVSPAGTVGNWPVYVVNSDGATAISLPGIAYSGTPTWLTASGNIAQVYEVSALSTTISATGDVPIGYSIYSGSLPSGASLNGANGLISGTTAATASSTTYSFTARATDAQQQDTNRAFTITVNPDVVTWSSPAANTTSTLTANVAMSNVTMVATSAAGFGIVYTANTLPTGVSITGANIAGTPTVTANTSSLLTATANTSGRTSTRVVNWIVEAIPATTTVDYLVVAGGGGGGGSVGDGWNAGGGGAGGFRTASGFAVASGTPITVTVGAGGGPGTTIISGSTATVGENGGNSVFSSITSIGGGGGGAAASLGGGAGPKTNGLSGGSGGGAGTNYQGGTPSGGAGTAGQGNNGGSGSTGGSGYGGGGGGSGGVGSSNVSGGGAGAGTSSSITGSAVTYAAGGGTGISNPTNATANTGNGGNGVNCPPGVLVNSASGGSGIVVVRYPDTYRAAISTTGSPTITVAGGYRVYKWTTVGTWSITF